MEKDRTRDAAQTQLPRWDGPLTHPFYSKVLKRCLDFSLAVVFSASLPCGDAAHRHSRQVHV